MTFVELINRTDKEEFNCVIARNIVNLWMLEAHMHYCLECKKWLNIQEERYGEISLKDEEVVDN